MKSEAFKHPEDYQKNEPLDTGEQQTLMKLLVHTCDISNCIMDFKGFKQWGLRITQEFDDLYVAE
jgi:hypothetical protein